MKEGKPTFYRFLMVAIMDLDFVDPFPLWYKVRLFFSFRVVSSFLFSPRWAQSHPLLWQMDLSDYV